MVIAAALVACSDDPSCGPVGDETGITLASSSDSALYDDFTASANNDCPSAGSPTSITIASSPSQGAGSIVLCLSQPDQVADDWLDVTESGALQLVSVATDAGCPTILDRSQSYDVQARMDGFCGNGTNAAGFRLELRGTLSATRECPDQAGETITLTLAGAAAVLGE